MNKLLIVDGSNLLFQMFFGMPARIVNESGKAIQGTLGFVGAFLKIAKLVEPTHICALFDGEHENARVKVDAGYKANRTDYALAPEEESPFSQIGDVYAALDYMGVKRAETTECETDDWIASYALAGFQNMEIVIASFDSDFFQLVSKNVSVLRYRGEKTQIFGPEDVYRRFGVAPDKYAAFKALAGDAADNIKGAERVGPKTAAALLNRFQSLEGIIANASVIEKPSIRESILKNDRRLIQNLRLIRLTADHDVPFPPESLRCSLPRLTTSEVLKGIGLK